MEFLFAIGLFFSLFSLGLLIGFLTKKKPTQRGEDVPALEVTHEEFYKILNFMLLYGIIDFNEYGKIEKKSLPYVR